MKNFIKSVLILCAFLFSVNASAQTKWTKFNNKYYKYSYTVPNNYYEIFEEAGGVLYYRYHDGIEIITFGYIPNDYFNYAPTLKELYHEFTESNPILQTYKDTWFVVSDDNYDGPEYYARCGSYYTNIEGIHQEVIALMIIHYPKTAKKRAQQIIHKCFKGFPLCY